MKCFDTHAHLDFYSLEEQQEILKTCQEKEVSFLHLAIEESKYEFLDQYQYPYAIGVHPLYGEFCSENYILNIKKYLTQSWAIGEIGLDASRKEVDEKQLLLFKEQLNLAIAFKKPVIIHTRDASELTKKILQEYSGVFVLHSFTGDDLLYQFALDSNCYIGLNGMITFKKNQILRDKIKTINPKRILLETDSPFLTPEPYRGHKNKPYHVLEVLSCLNEVFSKDLTRLILHNTEEFFQKEIKVY